MEVLIRIKTEAELEALKATGAEIVKIDAASTALSESSEKTAAALGTEADEAKKLGESLAEAGDKTKALAGSALETAEAQQQVTTATVQTGEAAQDTSKDLGAVANDAATVASGLVDVSNTMLKLARASGAFGPFGKFLKFLTNPITAIGAAFVIAAKGVYSWLAAIDAAAQKQEILDAINEHLTNGVDAYRAAVIDTGDKVVEQADRQADAYEKVKAKLLELQELQIKAAVREGRMTETQGAIALGDLKGQAAEETELNALRALGAKIFAREQALHRLPQGDPATLAAEAKRQADLAAISQTDFDALRAKKTTEIHKMEAERAVSQRDEFGRIGLPNLIADTLRGFKTPAEGIKEAEAELELARRGNLDRQRQAKAAADAVKGAEAAEKLRADIDKLRAERDSAQGVFRQTRPINRLIGEARTVEEMNRINDRNLAEQNRADAVVGRVRGSASGFSGDLVSRLDAMSQEIEQFRQQLREVKSPTRNASDRR